MQIPDTDNLDYQHAFKRGYRLGLEGKLLNSMPNTFRQDLHKRDYFQQGWDQAKEDLIHSDMLGSPTCWRCRITWYVVMILGGLATAYLIIHKYDAEQAYLAQQAQRPNEQTPSLSRTESLALLSVAQRADIEKNQLELAKASQALPPITPIVKSDIKISNVVLSAAMENSAPSQPLQKQIPKYIREIYFFTQIENTNEQTLYHRWRYNNQYLATIPLTIKSTQRHFWSSKKMSSAWQGQWYIEVINEQQDVIYRQSFIYGKQ
ncbi:MAG: hypothetical protein ISEC1_P2014 [Thiomicrorhabdus sp.]|nr:MAG: hypothetical protein ISEC1_P2014 [Thiomicrorhabdus sp.]